MTTMMNEFRVGEYRCEMSYSQAHGLRSEWSPHVPNRNLSKEEWEQYRRGRDALVKVISDKLGVSVAVMEC